MREERLNRQASIGAPPSKGVCWSTGELQKRGLPLVIVRHSPVEFGLARRDRAPEQTVASSLRHLSDALGSGAFLLVSSTLGACMPLLYQTHAGTT